MYRYLIRARLDRKTHANRKAASQIRSSNTVHRTIHISEHFSKMEESFVLVYLSDVKKYVTVPENFVFDLNQLRLKNNGVNRNQSFKIFWSNDMECEIPDFHAKPCDVHPPIEEIACYRGHIYRFFSMYFVLLLNYTLPWNHNGIIYTLLLYT